MTLSLYYYNFTNYYFKILNLTRILHSQYYLVPICNPFGFFWFYYDLRYTLNRLLNYFVMTTHLKISVHDTLFVHIIHSSQHLADQMGCILFGVRTLLHYAVEQLSVSYPEKAYYNI